jgi:hypothetical protein
MTGRSTPFPPGLRPSPLITGCRAKGSSGAGRLA